MKKTPRILIIIILIITIVGINPYTRSYAINLNTNKSIQTADMQTSTSSSEKIDANLYEKADIKNDKYLVYLWRESISEKAINERLQKETGYDASVYESKDFEKKFVPTFKNVYLLYPLKKRMQK